MTALACGHEHDANEPCGAYLGDRTDEDTDEQTPVFGFGRHESGRDANGNPEFSYRLFHDHCPLIHLEEFAEVLMWGKYHAADPRTFDVNRSSADKTALVLEASLMLRGH